MSIKLKLSKAIIPNLLGPLTIHWTLEELQQSQTPIRRFEEDYAELEREQYAIVSSERAEAQARIENYEARPTQRFAWYWGMGMAAPEKVTSMARWDELARLDRKARGLARTEYVRALDRERNSARRKRQKNTNRT